VLDFGIRSFLMGVVNVTPDSFSDGGDFLDPHRAIEHGLSLAKAGADLLDVGGESTRPGAPPVPAAEELRRILPVIRALAERGGGVPISVDTRKAEVAKEALAAGACLVNDVTGFSDPEMAKVVADAGAACCLMHIQGTPQTMQDRPHYGDVVDEVLEFLRGAVERALAAGIPRERILVDPGIGFGKTMGHNLFLLRRLQDLRLLGLPILVGTSRKSFLGRLTGGKPVNERLAATLGSVAAVAVLGGADLVRVHDVAETQDVLLVAESIRGAREGGELYTKPTGGGRPSDLHNHG
jgi:dihydropteroate synthase